MGEVQKKSGAGGLQLVEMAGELGMTVTHGVERRVLSRVMKLFSLPNPGSSISFLCCSREDVAVSLLCRSSWNVTMLKRRFPYRDLMEVHSIQSPVPIWQRRVGSHRTHGGVIGRYVYNHTVHPGPVASEYDMFPDSRVWEFKYQCFNIVVVAFSAKDEISQVMLKTK